VRTNCTEHLAILDRLDAGDRRGAAALMRAHLEGAALLRHAAFHGRVAGPPPA
jgi:DNA-binding GntR family transcriptional regulator